MDALPEEHQTLTRILIDKGLLSQGQITGVLEYQCRLPPGQYMSFTDIVLEFEYLTEAQLIEALGNRYNSSKDPVSRILIEQGIVSGAQLEQALTVLDTFSREHVAEVLIDLGFATPQSIEQAISKHQLEQSQKLKTSPSNANEQSLKDKMAQAFGAFQESEKKPKTQTKTPESGLQEPMDSSVLTPVTQTQMNIEQGAVHLPLGRRLIAMGHLAETELRDALAYQQRLPHVMHKPLGKILVEMGYISEDLLTEMLEKDKQTGKPSRVGEVLVAAGIIEEWQLAHALRLQFTPSHAKQRLGEIIVDMGYTTRDVIEGALARHYRQQDPKELPKVVDKMPELPFAELAKGKFEHRPLGQMMVEREYITKQQLTDALILQKELADEYTPLGDILIMQGHLTEAQLQEVLQAQGKFQRKPLGQILLDMGALEEWQLSHSLCLQHDAEQHKPLGQILIDAEYVTHDQVLSALKQQNP